MRLKIHHKITLILSTIMVLILSGTYFYLKAQLTIYTYQRIQNTLVKDLNFASEFIKRNLFAASDLQPIDQVADVIGQSLQLRATVIALDGKVLGDSQISVEDLPNIENHLHRPEIQQALKQGRGNSRRFSTTLKKDMLYMAQPFQNQYRQGFIRLAIPLSDIDSLVQSLRKVLLFSFFWTLVLVIIAGHIVSLIITKPILKISSYTQSFADGDYSQRILLNTNDELEDLAKTINYMSDQIKARISDVITNKSRMEAVLLSMVEGVMVLDNNGTILLLNQTLKDFLQIKQDFFGRKPLEVIRNIEIQELANKVLKENTGVQSSELTALLPQEKILLIHATPIIRQDKIDGAVLVFHDITELRRLERIRKDFVANVSHELRTPVSTIKGYAETLLDGALDDRKNARDFVGIIHSDSQRLANLINDLLDLSKIESGKMIIDQGAISLNSIIDRVVKVLEKKILEKNLKVSFNLSNKILKVWGDENAVSQIFLNLVENAIKYNVDGGSIQISAQTQNDFVKVNIEDTGIGIPAQDIPRIFERFYRVDKAHSRQLGGTGLGLSIVKHLVQAHGGEVSVSSVLEQGTIFSVTLPKA
ncbi:MAG: HAMP domain-containing protein [Candidatus Omnitrophica bacterium]|nr:HAMP domain-containing protein [Candidatus Omnitrophota bacterium]